MKFYRYILQVSLILVFFLTGTLLTNAEDESNSKKGEFFYGIVLNEKADKTKIDKMKKVISKEYRVENMFFSLGFLTFSTTEEINVVSKKLSKYGKVELLPNNYSINSSEEPLWDLTKTDIDKSRNGLGLTGKNVNVAVIDTGITHANPELFERISASYHCHYEMYDSLLTNDDDSDNDFYYKNCQYNTSESDITGTHGTHVAGIIASKSFGVSPSVNLFDFRVGPSGGTDNAIDARSIFTAYEQIIYLIDHGVDIDILNMSYGREYRKNDAGFDNGVNSEKEVLNELRIRNVMLVAAAGNPCRYERQITSIDENGNPFIDYECVDNKLMGYIHGEDENKIIKNYPSDYDFVISVGAINDQNTRGIFDQLKISNTSENLGLVAPGVDIESFVPTQFDINDGNPDGIEKKSGTSMAAPHVAGILALYKENYPSFSSKELEGMLYEETSNLGNDTGWDRVFGYGLANAVPPKHFEINKTLSLKREYNVYNFASDKARESSPVQLYGEYQATRATGWNESKKRFEYYRIHSRNTDEIIGWIKADDSLNNIDSDRESMNFTSDTLKIYTSPNEVDFEQEIDINPKRVRTHVSEDKAIFNAETGNFDWYKINLPEYEIFNKWIKAPQTLKTINNDAAPDVEIVSPKYTDLNFKASYNTFSLTFYDDPQTESNPVVNNQINNVPMQVNKGYMWDDSKNGFVWYRVSVPEQGIVNKWIKTEHQFANNIYQYGLMENVSGKFTRVVSSYGYRNLKYNNSLLTTLVGDTSETTNSLVEYRFDTPLSVNHFDVKTNNTTGYENLVVELLDANSTVLYRDKLSAIDNKTKRVTFKNNIENVQSYRITNTGTKDIALSGFDLFGNYTNSASPSLKINFEEALPKSSYKLYDEPNENSPSTLVTNSTLKKAKTTEGYYWVDQKEGYRWYKVSIPELNVTNKWINTGDDKQFGGEIYKKGLMNETAGRSILETTNSYFNRLKLDSTNSTPIQPYFKTTYRFEQPVTVDSFYLEKYFESNRTLSVDPNFKLSVQFLDANKNPITFTNKEYQVVDRYVFDNKEDFYAIHQSFPDSIENVSYYILENLSDKPVELYHFELFGSFNTSALPSKAISFNDVFQTSSQTFYDEPNTYSPSTKVNNANGQQALATEGYFWIEEKQGYRWYKVSVPTLGIVNKWVNTGDDKRFGFEVYKYGLLDKVTGSVASSSNFPYFDRIKTNSFNTTPVLGNSTITYRFDSLVSVNRLFISSVNKRWEPTTLKLELLNDNSEVVKTHLIQADPDFFEQFVQLPETTENVRAFRLSNSSSTTVELKSFDLFGSPQ